MSHIAASRKPYSPRRHGDTEKNKVKGKTGAQGGGGGHGGVRFPRSGESSLRAKISAASNTSLSPRCLHLSLDESMRPIPPVAAKSTASKKEVFPNPLGPYRMVTSAPRANVCGLRY